MLQCFLELCFEDSILIFSEDGTNSFFLSLLDQIFDHDCSCFCLLVDVLSDVLYSSVLHFLVTDLAYFFRLFVYFSLFSNSPLDLNFLVFGKKIIKDRVESLEDGFDLSGLKVVE